MSSLSNKTIAITGAASGMGLEIAKHLAAQGARVSITDIQAEALHQVTANIEQAGGKVISVVADVRDRSQVEAWIQTTVDTFGPLDGCVNFAGVASRQHGTANIEDIDDADWDFLQAVNVKGMLNSLRAEIPHMNPAGGSIVNAASVSGLMGFARTAAYCASKFAVVGMTKCAAKELGKRNIRCNCICPGVIDTPMIHDVAGQAGERGESYKAHAVPLGRLGTPGEVAKVVEFLLGDGATYVSGTAVRVDGGWVDY